MVVKDEVLDKKFRRMINKFKEDMNKCPNEFKENANKQLDEIRRPEESNKLKFWKLKPQLKISPIDGIKLKTEHQGLKTT
jgi:hypothetical protein